MPMRIDQPTIPWQVAGGELVSTGSRQPRLYEIDLLRIVAALAVVLYHYLFSGFAGGRTSVEFPAAGLLARYGYLGVDLFFAISGFVVLMSAWQRPVREFMVSRVVRLYPAYWVCLTVTAAASAMIGGQLFPVSPGQYLANLTMLNSFVDVENVDVVYWTLWSEIRFYAIIGVLTVIGMTRRRVLTALWIWLAATAVLETGVLPRAVSGPADLVVQSQFSHYFIAGMALYLIRRFGRTVELSVVLTLCLANALYRGAGFAAAIAARYQQDLHVGVVLALIGVIFVVLAAVTAGVTARWGRPWFAVAGDLTYPLYLLHAHLGFMLFNVFDDVVPGWALAVGLVVLMLVAAHVVHIGVERPVAPVLRHGLRRLLRIGGGPSQPAAGSSWLSWRLRTHRR